VTNVDSSKSDRPTLNPRSQFAILFEQDEQNIDLVEAALLIAADHHPEFDLDNCHQQIEALAQEARDHVELNQETHALGQALCNFLYREAAYSGDHSDYYNPDNSYLDRVLQRRKGIPITLALVYIAVGRHLGLTMEPVGFPGHFLVKLIGDEDIILDPFSGQVLSENDCRELLKTCTQDTVAFQQEHLDSVGNREVVRRILGNLKGIYLGRQELDQALAICDQLLLISKDSPRDIMDRAFVLEKMDCHAAAAEDLEYLLTLAPPPQVSKSIQEKITELRNQGGSLLH
jgi:regulator of sirC expression with transglutaminase-like and TPR domain